MRVRIIQINVDAFGMVPKVLEKELEELEISRRFESMQTLALLKSMKELRSVLKI